MNVAAAVRAAVPLTGRPRTADLGAGTGLLARSLADELGPTTLLDSSEPMVETARATLAAAGLADWTALVADLEHEDLPGGPYDLVISQLALHHVRDVAGLLQRVFTALNPGGLIALADLDHDRDGWFHRHAPDFDGHHGFDRGQLTGWLEDAGFGDIDFATATTLTKEVEGVDRDFPLFLVSARRPLD